MFNLPELFILDNRSCNLNQKIHNQNHSYIVVGPYNFPYMFRMRYHYHMFNSTYSHISNIHMQISIQEQMDHNNLIDIGMQKNFCMQVQNKDHKLSNFMSYISHIQDLCTIYNHLMKGDHSMQKHHRSHLQGSGNLFLTYVTPCNCRIYFH